MESLFHSSKLLSLHAIYATAANAKQNFLTKVLGVTAAQEDLVTVNSWKDVLDLVDEAVKKYDKSGKVRKGMRKLSDNAPAIQAWMGLFPSTSYSSTLCSGIKMVLDVCIPLDYITVSASSRSLTIARSLPESVNCGNRS